VTQYGPLLVAAASQLDLDASILCVPSGAYSAVMNLACLAGYVALRHSLRKALSSGIAQFDRG
jgi:hypothetical protein